MCGDWLVGYAVIEQYDVSARGSDRSALRVRGRYRGIEAPLCAQKDAASLVLARRSQAGDRPSRRAGTRRRPSGGVQVLRDVSQPLLRDAQPHCRRAPGARCQAAGRGIRWRGVPLHADGGARFVDGDGTTASVAWTTPSACHQMTMNASIAANMIVKTRLLHPPKRTQRAGCGTRIHTRPRNDVTSGVRTTSHAGKTV